MSRLGEWSVYLWPPALALAALAIVWEAWVRLADVPTYIVPAPTRVLERLFGDLGFFLGHAATTIQTAAVGFALGATVAIAVATVMAHSRLAERAILPVAIFVRVIPLIVWALMFVVWFGFGFTPKVLIVVLITFFPIMVNALTGLRSVNPGALDFFPLRQGVPDRHPVQAEAAGLAAVPVRRVSHRCAAVRHRGLRWRAVPG